MSTFLDYQSYSNNFARSLSRVAAEPNVAHDQAYYDANIGKVTSVDQFLNNYQLFTHAMTAYDLHDLGNAKGLMKKVLESDLSDPHSFANSLSDTRYAAFAKAFQFSTKGTVTNNAVAQTSDQQSTTTLRYALSSTASAADQKIATAYYNAHIGAVTSVAGLEKDSKLDAYVRTAYGLDSTVSDATIASAMERDLSDPNSVANKATNGSLKALAASFNFASDGSVADQRVMQSTADIDETAVLYTAAAVPSGANAATTTAATTESSYYKTTMSSITNLNTFLGDKRLVAYVEKAYGIPTTTTTSQLKAVLESNLSDPKSTANTLGQAYRTLSAAFDVSATGTFARQPAEAAQSKSQIIALHDDYLEQTEETEAGNANPGVQLALYFHKEAPTITNAFQLLGDKALTKVVHTLLSLPDSASSADIDSQARTINSKINIADFQNPAKLNKLIARFSALYDLQNPTSTANTTVSLFGNTSSS